MRMLQIAGQAYPLEAPSSAPAIHLEGRFALEEDSGFGWVRVRAEDGQRYSVPYGSVHGVIPVKEK